MKQPTISEFIKGTISEIEAGLPEGYSIEETIDFEISLTTNTSKDGNLNIQVFSGNLKDDKEASHMVSFSVINSSKKDEDGKRFVKHFVKSMKQLSKIGEQTEQNK